MKEPKELGFSFVDIGLVEAQNVIAAGDGKYSDLLIMLTETLPAIEQRNADLPSSERKGFAFGLPNGNEVDEKDRRGICHVVNLRLNRAGIAWRISYSGTKKLFICVPRQDKIRSIRQLREKNINPPDIGERIIGFRKQGMKYREIAKKLGITNSFVSYYLNQKIRRQGKALRRALKQKGVIQ